MRGFHRGAEFLRRLQVSTISLLLVSSALFFGSVDRAQGVAYIFRDFGGGPDNDGIGLATPVPAGTAVTANTFFRWEQASITYSFAPSFTHFYGAAGVAKVDAAIASWNAAVAVNAAPGIDLRGVFGGGDIALQGITGNFDLQSVALHEIGHVLGSDHPDVASLLNNNTTSGFVNPPVVKNYNVNAGAFVVGALATGMTPAHPVMWSTLANNVTTQSLTNDDLFMVQHLYDAGAAGNGQGNIGGPVFGDGAVAFTFNKVASGGNLVFSAATADSGFTALASTGVTTALKPTKTYHTASAATITFLAPEPSTFLLVAAGAALLAAMRRSNRRL